MLGKDRKRVFATRHQGVVLGPSVQFNVLGISMNQVFIESIVVDALSRRLVCVLQAWCFGMSEIHNRWQNFHRLVETVHIDDKSEPVQIRLGQFDVVLWCVRSLATSFLTHNGSQSVVVSPDLTGVLPPLFSCAVLNVVRSDITQQSIQRIAHHNNGHQPRMLPVRVIHWSCQSTEVILPGYVVKYWPHFVDPIVSFVI